MMDSDEAWKHPYHLPGHKNSIVFGIPSASLGNIAPVMRCISQV